MPRQRKVKEEGLLDFKRVRYQNGELVDQEEYSESVKAPTFSTEVGRINVRGSITRNLGDFNSIRVECGLELPCLPELTEADRVYKICSEFVEGKLKQELDNAQTERSQNATTEESSGPIKRRALFG